VRKLEAGLQKLKEQKTLIEHTYPVEIKESKASLDISQAEHRYAFVIYNRIKPLTEQKAVCPYSHQY
jgi:hypothetical protein